MGQIAILEAFSDLPDARRGQRMLTLNGSMSGYLYPSSRCRE
ncbi:hypothetical protein [Moorena sp. SIO1G6]|nr:hypothetical protein [Moorena sp. SIO1G6]